MCKRDVLGEATALLEANTKVLCRVGQTGELILELKPYIMTRFVWSRVLGRVQG